jgi:hypothetical protein
MKMERTGLVSEWDRQTSSSLLAELREIFFSFIFAEIRAHFPPDPKLKKMGKRSLLDEVNISKDRRQYPALS